ncbi:hypothetical protein DW322_17635 [Rhodococcus rhodnii]|uniref:UsfY protein n=2 Tax=Rhodococcus rhodnii TaxID=38312 RepID=R7WI65_9NOCA|nr:hypothetical protein [Rhodococcus rhodnii]EOM74866.1 hypothetical protein Rrhod_3743 [Rhodococcus rhodnii LMG 5362]TXG91680.1 hypothetical protein DW322_17635 [Rhodococcus rhodnii]
MSLDSYEGDASRVTRGHVGTAMTDTRGYPGFILIGGSFAVLGLFIVALGYGFAGWAVIAGIAFVVMLGGGVTYALLEHRRIVRVNERENRPDLQGH